MECCPICWLVIRVVGGHSTLPLQNRKEKHVDLLSAVSHLNNLRLFASYTGGRRWQSYVREARPQISARDTPC